MAFNFNWSPLIADTVRARELLTTALNKSPKPPIIVDDIVVTELNLGTVPPDLEILEIGDLADDRFRGIFKMTYAGDAFLTLKTRVQANPLNTYLSTRPTFASPSPLAAASGLTIPLQITLSDIKLSGFVILVFSRQKGLTLVFRNDPLESLKVSSTFDSIPFVRDYLQREIEGQLRLLFMEDLPAILHKLSLRLWSPDYIAPADLLKESEDTSAPIDPLSSPPQDPMDASDPNFDEDSIPSMNIDGSQDAYINFSQKNLHQLSSLSDSQHTLSIATPQMSDVVYRAWATFNDRGSGIHTPSHAGLSRVPSSYASSIYSMGSGAESEPTRPTLSSASSYSYSRSTTSGNGRRKRKHRVIDLRRKADKPTEPVESTTQSTTPEPSIAPSTAPSIILNPIPEEPTPRKPSILLQTPSSSTTPKPLAHKDLNSTPIATADTPPAYTPSSSKTTTADYFSAHPITHPRQEKPPQFILRPTSPPATHPLFRSLSADRLSPTYTHSTGGILEQAWMRKMAGEIARKVAEEQRKGQQSVPSSSKGDASGAGREEGADVPPPAYVS